MAPPVRKDRKKKDKAERRGDPEYARYLKQVIEILENDDDYVKKLLNASEEELRTGQVADDLDLVKHDVRTKLDELKRQEIERQRMIRRQMNDHINGLKEREYWNPVFDDENPNFFGPEDFKKLLWKVGLDLNKRIKLYVSLFRKSGTVISIKFYRKAGLTVRLKLNYKFRVSRKHRFAFPLPGQI